MRILFQGDSITDNQRSEDGKKMGKAYPKFAVKYLKEYFPAIDFDFINRAVSGNEVWQVLERLQEDIIDIQPDIFTILIGINDSWHAAESGKYLDDDIFEAQYREILEAVKTKTHAKIVMIEEFLFPVEEFKCFRFDVDKKIQITRKLAREYADLYIPLDGIFAAQSVRDDFHKYTKEGVHPTDDIGADFIGRTYADWVSEIIEELYTATKE